MPWCCHSFAILAVSGGGRVRACEGGGTMFSPELLRGCIESLILAILHDGDTYGYVLAQEITARSGGQLVIKTSTLYPVLRRGGADRLAENYLGGGPEPRRHLPLPPRGGAGHPNRRPE